MVSLTHFRPRKSRANYPSLPSQVQRYSKPSPTYLFSPSAWARCGIAVTSLLDAPSLAVCVIFNRSIQPSSSQFELRLSWPSLQPTLSNDESPAHLRKSPRNRLNLRCGLPPSRILMTRGILRDIGA